MTNANDRPDRDDCRAVAPVLARVGERWSMLIVMVLSQGSRRFNELKRSTGGISQRMLTLTLRRLERDGLVERTVLSTVPPGVEYALSDLGQSLASPVAALGAWARLNHTDIARSRARFDAAAGRAPHAADGLADPADVTVGPSRSATPSPSQPSRRTETPSSAG